MSAENIHLTSSEWHVMEFLWDHTPCTGREATSCLEKTMGWSRSTTLTLLRRLESKGAVASDTDHGKKSFRPLVKRDAAVLQETKHFLHRVYHGSLSLMVSSLTQKQALPQEEIDALYALLRELEEHHDVLLAGFLVLRHILTAAMSRRLQYALWAIVLLRLLLPFSFGETGFSVMNVPPVQMLTAGIDSSFDGITSLASSQQETGPSLSPQPISSPDQITPTRVLFYFWLAGTLGIGAYFAAVNLHFALRLRRSRQAVKCKQARLPVYKTDAIGSPCLFGLFPSAIYVTSEALEDPTVFRHVIAHETTHFLHGDAFWSLLRGICVALHWYNPLVWWEAVLSHRDSETACDEATLQRLGQEERAAYGRTLIRMACQKSVNPFILSAPLADNRQFLGERIARVVQKGKNKIT